MEFQRADGGDDHRQSGDRPALRHLMSKNFSRAEIGAEAGFGHDIVGELQRQLRRQHRVAAMGDVGERAAMHEGRIVLQRLHEIRLDARP